MRPFLLNFLVPLHVMAEVAGLSMSVQVNASSSRRRQRDTFRMEDRLHRRRRETVHFEWYAIRGWTASRVVYEHHYGHEQIGGPLTQHDLNFDWGRSEVGFQSPS